MTLTDPDPTTLDAEHTPATQGTAAGPILVVDDDPDIVDVLTALLEMEGYPVVSAANGVEALDLIERQRPSLILLDMRMPVLDGWGVARELKARGIDIPIVVITAERFARDWADEIGAKGFVAKPFQVPAVLDAVARLRDSAPGGQT